MSKSRNATVVVGAVVVAATSVNAFEFRARWVERVGNTDIVLANDRIDLFPGQSRRVRLQLGVFDDAAGAAPAGGFVGWNVGTLDVEGTGPASTNTRTPGRLSPWTFAQQPGANGSPPLPAGDPFLHLTSIDATLAPQSPFWGCDANGNPAPQPAPTVRGYNTFVSVYEVTSTASLFGGSYSMTAGGNLIAATEWRTVGTPFPPDCSDPQNPTPGSVVYAPFPTPGRQFSSTLQFIVPAPGMLGIYGVFGAGAVMRWRHRR